MTKKTSSRRLWHGFTLVEVLAVITIIVLLAGVVTWGMNFVSQRQAKEKARTQIAMLSKALEDYKADQTNYPATGNGDGTGNTRILFNALWWDTDGDGQGATNGDGSKLDPDQPIYLSELDPINNKQGWLQSGANQTNAKIVDPWGNEYRYRTAVNGQGQPNAKTQNQDFDLWSAGPDGRTNPGVPGDEGNADDIWVD